MAQRELAAQQLEDVPCAPTNDACGDKGCLAHMREAVMVIMGEVKMPCKYQNLYRSVRDMAAL